MLTLLTNVEVCSGLLWSKTTTVGIQCTDAERQIGVGFFGTCGVELPDDSPLIRFAFNPVYKYPHTVELYSCCLRHARWK